MKRKIYRLLRTAALLCMMAVLLCGTASANSLPPEYMVLVKAGRLLAAVRAGTST